MQTREINQHYLYITPLQNGYVQEQHECVRARRVLQQGNMHILWLTYSNNVCLRNLCALEWVISNPKGTTDDFSNYYDSLSAEGKQVSIPWYYYIYLIFLCFRNGKSSRLGRRSRAKLPLFRLRDPCCEPICAHSYLNLVYRVINCEFDGNRCAPYKFWKYPA